MSSLTNGIRRFDGALFDDRLAGEVIVVQKVHEYTNRRRTLNVLGLGIDEDGNSIGTPSPYTGFMCRIEHPYDYKPLSDSACIRDTVLDTLKRIYPRREIRIDE
jgi:hypothetical protein